MVYESTTSSPGLVLEGGAMRGLFTAGVIDVMMEQDLWPSGVIGVSAGAAFGCNMKSRQPGRVIRYNKRFAHDRRYCSLWSLLKTGDIFGGEFCYHELPMKLDLFDVQTYEENPMKFYCVCTDVDTGQEVVKEISHIDDEAMEWLRASASMPIASKIVTIRGRKLLDGGIASSIPLRQMEERGYRRNIVVLTQPRSFVKEPGAMVPVIRWWLRKHPRFVEASDHRHEMYNRELDYLRQEEAAGRALVIAPPEKLPIGHLCHDTEQMQKVYEIGRQTATMQLQAIRDFFSLVP